MASLVDDIIADLDTITLRQDFSTFDSDDLFDSIDGDDLMSSANGAQNDGVLAQLFLRSYRSSKHV